MAGPVHLSDRPTSIDVRRPILVDHYFNEVCLRLGPDLRDGLHPIGLRSQNGQEIQPRAELVSRDGSVLQMSLRSFLYRREGRYFCLSSAKTEHAPREFVTLRLASNVPATFGSVMWLSTDED